MMTISDCITNYNVPQKLDNFLKWTHCAQYGKTITQRY